MTTIARPPRRLSTRRTQSSTSRIRPTPPSGRTAGGERGEALARTRTWERVVRTRLVLGDLAVVALTLGLGQVLADAAGSAVPSVGLTVLVGLSWVALLHLNHAYRASALGAGVREYRQVALAGLATAGLVALVTALLGAATSSVLLATLLLGGVVLAPAVRVLQRVVVRRSRRRGGLGHRAVVVGTPSAARLVARRLLDAPESGYHVRAVATGEQDTAWFEVPGHRAAPTAEKSGDSAPATPPQRGEAAQVLQWGRVENVVAAIRAGQADTVVVADQEGLAREDLREIMRGLDDTGARMVFVRALDDVSAPRLEHGHVNGLGLETVRASRFAGTAYRAKRLVDIVGSSLLILAAGPVLVATALAIRLDDGGPVLFRQSRVGTDGRLFSMTKFRSMVIDAEERKAAMVADDPDDPTFFKSANDDRRTRVGKVIRRWSIDELPQLFDVLRGDMSLVGPRPSLEVEVAANPEVGGRRLRVAPGLTGRSQVSGRSTLASSQTLRNDVAYAENWTLRGDLAILARTVRAVVSGRGAY